MKIVEKFAEYCGLADSEKAWLVEEVGEAARSRDEGASHGPECLQDHPSVSELDAFDEVVRGLLEKRKGEERSRGERAALRAKVARGCLRGVEQDELFLTDDTIVLAVDALHEAGALEPDDAHHLATFLGQFRASAQSDARHLAAVCEDLIRRESLTEVHKLDLVLAMLASSELPLPVRTKVLEAVSAARTLPEEVSEEILVRVLTGSNLYDPYWYEGADDYMDARPSWVLPPDPAQRRALVEALGSLALELTAESRGRAQAELDDLDDVLDWMETEEGAAAFETLACRMAERLPELLGPQRAAVPRMEGLPAGPGEPLYPAELRPLEPQVQEACDSSGAPRKAAEVVLTGLGYVLDELDHSVDDVASFARSIREGENQAEDEVLDIAEHVLGCSLQDSLNHVYVPLSQLADLSDEDLERIRELALAARDALVRGDAEGTISADLVELLAPFEGRTAARLNRFADEDLSFLAARSLERMDMPREELARLAAEAWDMESLSSAGADGEWVRRLIAEHAQLFEPDLVASVKNGAKRAHDRPERYN